MTPDPSPHIQRIRRLSQALILSGAINIGVLSVFLYWMLKERPPATYCELKPASIEQQQVPLADQRGFTEVLAQLSQLPLPELIQRLSHTQLIENGYAERDLALACLVAFHHFDIQRALSKNAQPQQKRLLAWKPKGQPSSIALVVYPDLNQQQFDSLIQFGKTERWPLTAEGLFLHLQEQKAKNEIEDHLIDTFVLTPEFWTMELLFNRGGQQANKQEILTVLLEGNWIALKQFVEQQRQVNDTSDARRQKFLLDYIKRGSPSAAILLLKMEWEFSVKKLDDQQVITILKLMSLDMPESVLFAKEMLASPRSMTVWRQASEWLYLQSGEQPPKQWNYQNSVARFLPEKPKIELVSKTTSTVSHLTTSLPLLRNKAPMTSPIKSPPLTKSDSDAKKQTKTIAKKSSEKKKNMNSSAQSIVYEIQEGDSLWKISRKFGVKIEEIKKINQLKTDALKPGIILKIPESKTSRKKSK